MEESFKVSVIMSAYNSGKYISKSIDSIINQTYTNIELIIVEDCSTDNTREIIEEYKKKDNRIKVIYHTKNLGAGYSRYDGVKKITGDYTLFVDSDDYIDNNWIESLVKGAVNSGADIVSGGMVVEYETDDSIVKDFLPVIECYLKDNMKFCKGANISYEFLNLSLVRAALWDKVDYCKWRFLEDTPTFVKLLSYAKDRQLISCTGYHYYQNSSSLCHTTSPYIMNIYRLKLIEELFRFQESTGKIVITIPAIVETINNIKFSDEDTISHKDDIIRMKNKINRIISKLLWRN